MQRLEVSGAVRPLKGSLGIKGLKLLLGILNILREKGNCFENLQQTSFYLHFDTGQKIGL